MLLLNLEMSCIFLTTGGITSNQRETGMDDLDINCFHESYIITKKSQNFNILSFDIADILSFDIGNKSTCLSDRRNYCGKSTVID
jgi:hypothetical protein